MPVWVAVEDTYPFPSLPNWPWMSLPQQYTEADAPGVRQGTHANRDPTAIPTVPSGVWTSSGVLAQVSPPLPMAY